MTQAPIPPASRPLLPRDYGVPQSSEGLLHWSFVSEHMQSALNYWIATVDSNNRPHATPVWGMWLDETFYFDGSPETRRGRNLAGNSNVTVHLESGSEVVILQGTVEQLRGVDHRPLTLRLAPAYEVKYASQNYHPDPKQWDAGGLYVVRPRLVLAWTKFPDTMTRWVFEGEA